MGAESRIITVHVVGVGSTDVPDLDALEGFAFERWFSQASGDVLELKLRHHANVGGPGPYGSADLHEILRAVIEPATERPVSHVALMFCSSWGGRPGLQGLMFDYDGFDEKLGQLTSDGGVPREGCAVFVDAFGAEPNPAELVFTAVHELGHVFNLEHDPRARSFMAAQAFSIGFSESDGEHLAAAGRGNWFYAPGGENFGRHASPARQGPAGRRRYAGGLRLRAALGKPAYLVGESVVLDLAVTPDSGRVELVPELDPGYDSLGIWIENEIGERWRHRPNTLFCRARKERVAATRSAPLCNNPRITLGADGSNFGRPGKYTVWAEFTVRVGRRPVTLRSTDIEFEILAPRGADEEEISAVLSRPAVGRFVAHKGGMLRRTLRSRLESVLRRAPRHPALQHVRYALAIDRMRRRQYGEAAELLSGVKAPEPSIRDGVRKARRSAMRQLRGR